MLGARNGIAIPGVSIFPVQLWIPLYDAVLDSVGKVAPNAPLVGLVHDVAVFPSFRRGSELWADRATFAAAFNVAISADCDGSPSVQD